MLPIDKRLL